MLRIALISRELHPLGGGGIGQTVAAYARTLERIAEVTIITSDMFAARYRELAAAGDPRLPPPRVRVVFVPEPIREDFGSYLAPEHLWSARVYEELRRLYPDGGPDIAEFPDYLGEGCVAVQAKRTHDPALRNTGVCVRLHTTLEICSVLNGYVDNSPETESVFELERYALRYADRLLWTGGDVLRLYRRFFGAPRLAPALQILHPLAFGQPPTPDAQRDLLEGPLRLLYVGRLERRKGVQNLMRAVTGLARDDWSLTLVGADTPTAPLGQSMRGQLELMAAGDRRIAFHGPVEREELAEMLATHHVLVVPSLWECWPNTALEAYHHDLPVIATPTGGLPAMVDEGRSGWLARDTNAQALADAIEHVLDNRDELESVVRSGGPRSQLEELTDEDVIRRQYIELGEVAAQSPGRADVQGSRPPPDSPLVSVVIPYFQLDQFITEAVRSVFEQSYKAIEVIIVNDGSVRERDWILGDLATRYPVSVLTQQNSGLGAARNAGIFQTRGRYVLPLDADNVLTPAFVARCVEVLEREPHYAFVTSWSLFMNELGVPYSGLHAGYQPLGNAPDGLDRRNIAGDAAAVVRRSVFDHFRFSVDLTSFEDWTLYRQLHRAGLIGHVIPERLMHYRVRGDSMIRQVGFPELGRLEGEMNAHIREGEISWTFKND